MVKSLDNQDEKYPGIWSCTTEEWTKVSSSVSTQPHITKTK